MTHHSATSRDPGTADVIADGSADRHRPGRTSIVAVDRGTEQALAALRGTSIRRHRVILRAERTP